MSADYKTQMMRGEISPTIRRRVDTSERDMPLPAAPEHAPWHQMEKEPADAYQAFLIYLDMGSDRSHGAVAKILYGKEASDAGIKDWSVAWSWVSRAEAWDSFISETRVARMEESVAEAEMVGIRNMPKVAQLHADVALGEAKATREQARMIIDFMDRYGPAKQRAQVAIQNNNYNVSYPELPSEAKKGIKDAENADFEEIKEEAASFIPDNLKK